MTLHKQKIIIDCDSGIDDAFAIAVALSDPRVEVMGITTVAGNKNLDKTTANALHICELMAKDTNVYMGASNKLTELAAGNLASRKEAMFHGIGGLGDTIYPLTSEHLSSTYAIDFIVDTIAANKGEVSIIALGPLTNIALAVAQHPDIMQHTKAIYSMGGAIDMGNVTPYAEFNYYEDAEAVATVLQLAKTVPFTMVPLNGTNSVKTDYNDIAFLHLQASPICQFLYECGSYYLDKQWNTCGKAGGSIHDLSTYLYTLTPSLATHTTQEKIRIHVEHDEKYGAIELDDNGTASTIVWAFDQDAHQQAWMDIIIPQQSKSFRTFQDSLK